MDMNRLQQQAAIARVARQQQNTHKAKLPSRSHGTASSYDADTGMDIIRLSDGSLQYALPDTTGVRIPGDQLIVRTGGGTTHIDAIKAKRILPIPSTRKLIEKLEEYPFKILFLSYDPENSDEVFYIGGDRPTPIEVFRQPYSGNFQSGNLTATGTGPNDWIVSILLSNSSNSNQSYDDPYRLVTIYGDGIRFETTEHGIGAMYCIGSGVWTTSTPYQVYGDYSDVPPEVVEYNSAIDNQCPPFSPVYIVAGTESDSEDFEGLAAPTAKLIQSTFTPQSYQLLIDNLNLDPPLIQQWATYGIPDGNPCYGHLGTGWFASINPAPYPNIYSELTSVKRQRDLADEIRYPRYTNYASGQANRTFTEYDTFNLRYFTFNGSFQTYTMRSFTSIKNYTGNFTHKIGQSIDGVNQFKNCESRYAETQWSGSRETNQGYQQVLNYVFKTADILPTQNFLFFGGDAPISSNEYQDNYTSGSASISSGDRFLNCDRSSCISYKFRQSSESVQAHRDPNGFVDQSSSQSSEASFFLSTENTKIELDRFQGIFTSAARIELAIETITILLGYGQTYSPDDSYWSNIIGKPVILANRISTDSTETLQAYGTIIDYTYEDYGANYFSFPSRMITSITVNLQELVTVPFDSHVVRYRGLRTIIYTIGGSIPEFFQTAGGGGDNFYFGKTSLFCIPSSFYYSTSSYAQDTERYVEEYQPIGNRFFRTKQPKKGKIKAINLPINQIKSVSYFSN